MLHARYKKYTLNFRLPAGTSRGTLLSKDSYFILIHDDRHPEIEGIGECSILKGLSPDDKPGLEEMISQVCRNLPGNLDGWTESLAEWPAIRSGIEMALADLENGGKRLLFSSDFSMGKTEIPVNGLIWMGDTGYMLQQIDDKIREGYKVIKMKVGAVSFADELALIRHIRKQYSAAEISIRLDANGAFLPSEAPGKLDQLAEFGIHSIEQPIRAGQVAAMADLCRKSPVPVALDEELIGIYKLSERIALLEQIMPQYIILKPSLLGGFNASQEWIELAGKTGTDWWVTSALESNIGLNAIAQWTATLNNPLCQGLGTGSLFTNNFPSPLQVQQGRLHQASDRPWDLSAIL